MAIQTDADLIARPCAAVALPVNVMMHDTLPDRDTLCRAGVARIRHGPAPFVAAMAGVTAAARAALG